MDSNNVHKLRNKLETNESLAFRAKFKAYRKEKEKDQRAIANELGVSIDTIRNWEQGFSMPGLDTLILISNYFGCSLDHMLGKAKERTHDLTTLCELTGLSEEAANTLMTMKEKADNTIDYHACAQNRYEIMAINRVFSDYENATMFWKNIGDYINSDNYTNGEVVNVDEETTASFDNPSQMIVYMGDRTSAYIDGPAIRLSNTLIKESAISNIRRCLETIKEWDFDMKYDGYMQDFKE